MGWAIIKKKQVLHSKIREKKPCTVGQGGVGGNRAGVSTGRITVDVHYATFV